MGSQFVEERSMDKELPLKIDLFSQLMSRVIVAETTYEVYAWVCGSFRG
jgi:hypothetical protein